MVVVAAAAYQQRAQPRAGLTFAEPNTEKAASTVALTFNQITVLMSYFYSPVTSHDIANLNSNCDKTRYEIQMRFNFSENLCEETA